MLDAGSTSHAVDEVENSGAPTTHRITIEHTFETAHRLPHLGGQCTSLHGHSWRVAVPVLAPSLDSTDLTVVEFDALKTGVRHWINTYLDHGTMLGAHDPLVDPLVAAGCKVFRFGGDRADVTEAEVVAADLAWPTVEAVAVLLRLISHIVLTGLPHASGARVGRVFVRETQVNTADYGPADDS
jgi:6-pyruvoyltetrahydropterin/6-carboxytetrahydropterin synthase